VESVVEAVDIPVVASGGVCIRVPGAGGLGSPVDPDPSHPPRRGVQHGDHRVAEFDAVDDDYSAILVKILADRLAEAFAEYMHMVVRREIWGYAPNEQLDLESLLKIEYQGIRPAPGYPPCPDHRDKEVIWKLLEPDARCGITLTESRMMMPGASVSGFYYSHPKSTYWGVGRLGKDQLSDYSRRMGSSIEESEKWLASVLGY
ncbi:MAG: vitamin B12 dependent-methionine synthase activation domain-containing protein, partial [Spirochaetota bacterium]